MKAGSSYSVLTRVRAQYGARMRLSDYMELASCKTVPEAASFLRERTPYGRYFSRENGVPTRGWLESQLRLAVRERSAALCRFGKAATQDFSEYVLLKSSQNELLSFLRCLSSGQPEKFVPSPSASHTHPYLTLHGLEQVRNRSQLIDCLHGTYFEKMLIPVLHDESEIDYPFVEAVLQRNLYEHFERKFRSYPAHSAKALSEILLLKSELGDVELLYRAKKYYGLSRPLLRAMMNGFRLKLTGREQEEMINAADANTVWKIFRESRYGKIFSGTEPITTENWADAFLPDLLRKQIHFSPEPSVVLFAYLNWMELEIKNLIYVIEGVRYRLPPEEILPLLMLPEQERA